MLILGPKQPYEPAEKYCAGVDRGASLCMLQFMVHNKFAEDRHILRPI